MAPMMTAMFGKPVTLATTPLPVLNSELKLDAGQKKRIDAIQGKLDKDVAAMSKGARSSDGLAMFSKMNDILAQADKDIDTELSAEQKAAAEMLLKNLTLLRESGLPPELYLELKLTGDQTKALTDALPDIKLENKERSRAMMAAGQSGDFKKVQSLMSKLGEKVSPILTKEQRSLVESYRKKHPQMAPTGISLGL